MASVEYVPKRYRTHASAEHGLAVREERPAPKPPSGLSAATRRWWADLWVQPVAAVWEDSDVHVVARLAELRDERRQIRQQVKREGMAIETDGAMPLRAHPLLQRAQAVDAEIRQLEDRLGLSPMSRLRLGITFADAKRAYDQLNKDVLDGWDE